MKLLARLFGVLSLGIGWLNLTEITRAAQLVLFIPKIIAGAVSPAAAALGGLAALIGWRRKDRVGLLMGLVGAGMALRHVARVTNSHDGFETAFGDGWRARLPDNLRSKMLPRRYSPPFPDPGEVVCLRDQVIGITLETGRPLRCDLWQPPAWVRPTGLAVIYLHGSGWHYADKDVGTRLFFRHLAAQGHLILDLAYSLAPGIDLRGMIGDVQRAILWLKAHGPNYRVDPNHIVLMGASAGGHLALLAAYAPHHPALQVPDIGDGDASVRAVVAYYAPADAEFYYRYSEAHFGPIFSEQSRLGRASIALSLSLLRSSERSLDKISRLRLTEVGVFSPAHMIARVLGGTPDAIPDQYRLASPIHHVGPHCPPTLLISGSHDIVMKPAMNRRLYAALREAGVQAVYVELPCIDHGLDLYAQRIAPAFQATTYDVERFLALMI